VISAQAMTNKINDEGSTAAAVSFHRQIGLLCVRLFGFSILLLALLTLGCGVPSAVSPGSPSEVTPGEVSFKLAGANEAALIVPVKINGKGPYDFVLDTGATFTCVDRKLAEELTLPDWSGPLGSVVITGGEGQMGFVKIDMLEVGDTAKASELVACKLDLSRMQPPGFGIKGLVGLNFLKSYRVTIDFERKSLRLDKPGP
jgi:predicted aspartyl protease